MTTDSRTTLTREDMERFCATLEHMQEEDTGGDYVHLPVEVAMELCRHWLATQWQPIETAPKDGRWIALSDGEYICTGRWTDANGWVHREYPPLGLRATHWQPSEPPK